MFDLTGKTILVTGASSGIGRECAIACSRLGAAVALFGRDSDRLAETRSLCAHRDDHLMVSLDLCDYDKVEAAIEECQQSCGELHGLVHAAGISTTMPLAATTPEDIDRFFATNVTSGVHLTKLAVKRRFWTPNGGSIVFISSVMGLVGDKGKITYSMTKSALLGGVRSMALELAARKIRVNAISPGVVDTPLSAAAVYSQTENSRRAIADLHPLGLGSPADVANAAVFLLSDEACWVTGTNLVIDGGYSAR